MVPAVSQAAPCERGEGEQPFLDWHDQASYFLVSGGDFESDTTGWTLADGAEVVSGGSPFREQSSASSLSLPAGASATTPAICVRKGDPVARIFMRSTDLGLKGRDGLRVEILYLNADGDVRKVKRAGWLNGGDEWDASRRFSLAQGQFGRGAKKPPQTPPGHGGTPPGQADEPHGPSNPPGQSDEPHGPNNPPGQSDDPQSPAGDDAPQGQGGGHGDGPKPDRSGAIQLRFTAGAGSDSQIDDVFVDPRARY
jgi:hypothetical protein